MDIFAEIEMEGSPQKENTPKPQLIGGGADPIRQRFYDMRSMASDNPYTWNEARLFYKQAKFMEDFADDYESHAEFSLHSPCFQRMGYERLRTYFTWRTIVRRGNFPDTNLSYIFLYIYELLACIGASGPAEALAGLVRVQNAYAEKYALNEYLPMWFKDFHIYYDLPQESSEPENELFTWNKLSAYDIEKSKFFTSNEKNASLYKDCFTAAINALNTLCAEKNLRLKDLFVLTGSQYVPWQPFRRAVFHPWLRQEDRKVELPCGEIYLCKNDRWTTLYSAPYAHRKDLISFIIKKVESVTRQKSDFKKITADTSSLQKASSVLNSLGIPPALISATIESAISNYFAEKNRIIVNVNRKNLEKIRVESEDITDKLIVEEIQFVESGDLDKTAPARTDTGFEGFLASLSETESAAFEIIRPNSPISDLSEIKAFANSKGIMLEILIDNINEKAMDTIGDNILELTDVLMVYDEYLNI
ncbi:MAG: TerB N-terminal domain-containing protein [Defluviitaleaceae bacterium]|nr:TerB N-terminal domain-containing protein [Defluviitaleaceae bacterium]